jgi:hypothetical protein
VQKTYGQEFAAADRFTRGKTLLDGFNGAIDEQRTNVEGLGRVQRHAFDPDCRTSQEGLYILGVSLRKPIRDCV